MATLTGNAKTLEVTECCVCAVDFAVPETIMENRRKNAGSIYCPNGHCIGWSKSEADKLREKLDAEKKNTEFWRTQAHQAEATAETLRRSQSRGSGPTHQGAQARRQRRLSLLQPHVPERPAPHEDPAPRVQGLHGQCMTPCPSC